MGLSEMTAFLLATLYAPMASWGDITVGERRTTWDRPSRSAIFGLIAAALGLVREDQSAHDALDTGYGFAVRVDAPGRLMADYHTAQSVPETALKKQHPKTRRQLLAAGKPETILSRREYRVDAAYTIALWAKPQARWSLNELAAALSEPAFVLYAGRKANPLGWPMLPEIVDASTLALAFATRSPFQGEAIFEILSRGEKTDGRVSVSSDHDFDIEHSLDGARFEIRRDAAPNRTRWQFAERRMVTGTLPLPLPTSKEMGA
jgi:CRISPR system Cascade subunit CasD